MKKVTKKNLEDAIINGFSFDFVGVPSQMNLEFEDKIEGNTCDFTIKMLKNRCVIYKERFCNEKNGKKISFYVK